jgi:hypothetical protein
VRKKDDAKILVKLNLQGKPVPPESSDLIITHKGKMESIRESCVGISSG